VILYQLLRISLLKKENGLQTSIAGCCRLLMLACAGAYRWQDLILTASKSFGFKGVPIPAAGLLIASFPLILHYGTQLRKC